MHVFIDTNILLDFFHYSKEDLDTLTTVFASHQHGSAIVHLTQQVCDEFRRNRESKIKDALKRFGEIKSSAQLPSFMRGYEEFEAISRVSNELQTLLKKIAVRVDEDIANNRLLADQLIAEILSKARVIEITPQLFAEAQMRVSLGNPPGKNGSVGDAVNWTILLSEVPEKQAIHIISRDGDFYSQLEEGRVHPFLQEEWRRKKRSELYVYRTLSEFTKKHYDGVAFAFDQSKELLIDELSASGSFASTHNIIAKLDTFGYFSKREIERILTAAKQNGQVGMIVTDYDVSDFLKRIAVHRIGDVESPEHRSILQKVIEEQEIRRQFLDRS